MLVEAMGRTLHEGQRGYPRHAAILTKDQQWCEEVVRAMQEISGPYGIYRRVGRSIMEVQTSRDAHSSLTAVPWRDEGMLVRIGATMGGGDVYADPDWVRQYHPVATGGRHLGWLPISPDRHASPSVMLPVWPDPREAYRAREEDALRPVEIHTVTLSIRELRYRSGPSRKIWHVEPDQLADLGRFGDLVPRSHTAGHWLAAVEQARDLERADAMPPGTMVGQITQLPIREARDALAAARARIVARMERSAFEAVSSCADPAAVPRCGPLTIERIRELRAEFDRRYPRASDWQRAMLGSFDYADIEQRLAAEMARSGPQPGRASDPAHCIDFGEARPRQEARHSSPLRPIEEWMEEAESVVAQARAKWLRRDQLPDARRGPAPVPEASAYREVEADRYSESAPDDVEPLAPPVSFLPPLEK